MRQMLRAKNHKGRKFLKKMKFEVIHSAKAQRLRRRYFWYRFKLGFDANYYLVRRR